MTTRLRPFLLEPLAVERPWGGRRLATFGTPLPEGVLIGESWELSDLADEAAPSVTDPRTRIATGPHVGWTLSQLIEQHREPLLGAVMPDNGRFPLLVKLLDARQPLSVQVHPPADYVAQHPEAALKTESWYVVDAEPGAELMLDLKDGVTMEDVEQRFGTGAFVELLRRVPARIGEFHHVPAGLVHSLGGGVLVAEVQTPSDTTFRIYDWSEELGRSPRQLHRREALASIRLHPEDAFSLGVMNGSDERMLVSTPHYWMAERRVHDRRATFAAGPGVRVVLVLSGALAFGGLDVGPGGTAVVPASWVDEGFDVTEEGVMIEIGFA